MEKLKRISVRLSMLAVISIFAASIVRADELTMKNGDRVSGKIVEDNGEVIILETEYAGRIRIVRDLVDKISAKESTAAAPAKAGSPDSAFAQPAIKVKTADAVAAKPAEQIQKPAARSLFGGPNWGIATGWDGNFNVGFSYTSGNSNNTTMSTGLRAVKTGGRDNLTVYVRSLWNSTRTSGKMTTTQNAFWGGVRYDRNINSKDFGFISYDFERDRPKNLNFRSVAGGGVGRHIIHKEHTEFDVLTGLAWNRTWQVGPNTDTPELLAGTTLKHRVTERFKIQKTFTYYQNTTDRNEYRFLFDTTFSVDVTKRVGVYFTIGDRFNNDPIGTARKNDFLFTTGMKWNFGRKK